MTSPEIALIVAEVYREHLRLPDEWTPVATAGVPGQDGGHAEPPGGRAGGGPGEQAVQEWTTEHGEHPDYLTKVGLLNTATASAKEIVLSEQLYELIPPPETSSEDLDPASPDETLPWTQRWTHTQYRTEPTEELEELAANLWPAPQFSALFRIKAGYLLAARAEDQLPLPRQAQDPLTEDLAQMVFQDLRDDGLPAR